MFYQKTQKSIFFSTLPRKLFFKYNAIQSKMLIEKLFQRSDKTPTGLFFATVYFPNTIYLLLMSNKYSIYKTVKNLTTKFNILTNPNWLTFMH